MSRMTIHPALRRSRTRRIVCTIGLFTVLGGCGSSHFNRTVAEPQYTAIDSASAHDSKSVTPASAKARLVEGNGRFVQGKLEHPRQSPQTRAELASGQAPFAVILGCADSRTPPETLFDQGLGDLFVARVAGNVVDDHVIGSVEYAVEHLHASLIVVMGHSKCGAIVAARDVVAADGHAEGHIESLVQAIRPAVEQTIGQEVIATCEANVRNMVHALRESTPILKHLVEEKKIEVIGAYYDLETGKVRFLDDKN